MFCEKRNIVVNFVGILSCLLYYLFFCTLFDMVLASTRFSLEENVLARY